MEHSNQSWLFLPKVFTFPSLVLTLLLFLGTSWKLSPLTSLFTPNSHLGLWHNLFLPVSPFKRLLGFRCSCHGHAAWLLSSLSCSDPHLHPQTHPHTNGSVNPLLPFPRELFASWRRRATVKYEPTANYKHHFPLGKTEMATSPGEEG